MLFESHAASSSGASIFSVHGGTKLTTHLSPGTLCSISHARLDLSVCFICLSFCHGILVARASCAQTILPSSTNTEGTTQHMHDHDTTHSQDTCQLHTENVGHA